MYTKSDCGTSCAGDYRWYFAYIIVIALGIWLGLALNNAASQWIEENFDGVDKHGNKQNKNGARWLYVLITFIILLVIAWFASCWIGCAKCCSH